MNTITNLVISFVVFFICAVFSFINAFKSAFVIGGIALLVIFSFPAGAHASVDVVQSGVKFEYALATLIGLFLIFVCVPYIVYEELNKPSKKITLIHQANTVWKDMDAKNMTDVYASQYVVLYHGSNELFENFSASAAMTHGANYGEDSFYFTTNPGIAAAHGKYVYTVRVNKCFIKGVYERTTSYEVVTYAIGDVISIIQTVEHHDSSILCKAVYDTVIKNDDEILGEKQHINLL